MIYCYYFSIDSFMLSFKKIYAFFTGSQNFLKKIGNMIVYVKTFIYASEEREANYFYFRTTFCTCCVLFYNLWANQTPTEIRERKNIRINFLFLFSWVHLLLCSFHHTSTFFACGLCSWVNRTIITNSFFLLSFLDFNLFCGYELKKTSIQKQWVSWKFTVVTTRIASNWCLWEPSDTISLSV